MSRLLILALILTGCTDPRQASSKVDCAFLRADEVELFKACVPENACIRTYEETRDFLVRVRTCGATLE